MKKKINIGIIGCGRIAQHYLDIFNSNKIKNFTIKFVCDLKISKAKKLSKIFKCEYGTDYKKLNLNHNIDLAIILTESGNHYKDSKFFLKNRVNVLVEKPVSFFKKQVNELIDLAKKNKLLFNVAFQNRLNPSIRFTKNLLNKKKFGKIISCSVRLVWCRYQDYYNDGWHGTWLMDGGVTNQQAIHHIDAITWLLGEVTTVSSFMTKRANSLEAEDTMVSILYFKNGCLGTIEATTAARPRDFEASININGTKGGIKIGGIALNKLDSLNFLDNKNHKSSIIKYSQIVENGYGLSHYTLIQNIIDTLMGKKKLDIINVSDTVNTTKLVNSMYKSDEVRKSVKLVNNLMSRRLGKKYARK